MRDRWRRNLIVGALAGLAIAAVAEFEGSLWPGFWSFFLIPGYGLADLVTQNEGVVRNASVLLSNAAAVSLIWAGLCSTGRWRWLARLGAVVIYVALVALSLSQFRVGI